MQSRFHNNAIIASPNTVALVHSPVSVAAGRVQRGRERELLASCVGVCVLPLVGPAQPGPAAVQQPPLYSLLLLTPPPPLAAAAPSPPYCLPPHTQHNQNKGWKLKFIPFYDLEST